MGDWIISIRGIGPHDNQKPFDVEFLLEKFLMDLKAAGHIEMEAIFSTNSRVLKWGQQ
jgi:hypothetical protein